jgi:hypothetical protein
MLEAAFHDLHAGKNQANVDAPKNDNEKAVLMPEFEPYSGATKENDFECRADPPEWTASVHKVVEAVKFLPGFFKSGMADGRKDSQRAFDGRNIGTEALPQH